MNEPLVCSRQLGLRLNRRGAKPSSYEVDPEGEPVGFLCRPATALRRDLILSLERADAVSVSAATHPVGRCISLASWNHRASRGSRSVPNTLDYDKFAC